MFPKKFIRTSSFQKTDCSRYRHFWRERNNHTDMVFHGAKFYYFNSVPLGDRTDCAFAIPPTRLFCKSLIPVLGNPLQAIFTCPYRMRVVRKVFIFIVSTNYCITFPRPNGRVRNKSEGKDIIARSSSCVNAREFTGLEKH